MESGIRLKKGFMTETKRTKLERRQSSGRLLNDCSLTSDA